jgi:hypothetical protein
MNPFRSAMLSGAALCIGLAVGTAHAQANANVPIAPTAQLSSSLVPPAPAGGLDPSKLPDILGIHIGEPTSQVIDKVKPLYPVVMSGSQIVSGKLGLGTPQYASVYPRYTSFLSDGKGGTYACSPSECLSADQFQAIFSGPPDTRVVQLKRSITWPIDKEPTVDTVKGALIKKYGQTYLSSVGGATLTWLFDEEGKPMAPFPQIFNGCSGPVASGSGPNPGLFNSYLGVTPNVTQGDLDRIVKARCGIKIWVQAQIGAQASGSAGGLDLTINEIAFDLRDAFAAENYIRQAKNAKGNQQLKDAQQQAAPKF